MGPSKTEGTRLLVRLLLLSAIAHVHGALTSVEELLGKGIVEQNAVPAALNEPAMTTSLPQRQMQTTSTTTTTTSPTPTSTVPPSTTPMTEDPVATIPSGIVQLSIDEKQEIEKVEFLQTRQLEAENDYQEIEAVKEADNTDLTVGVINEAPVSDVSKPEDGNPTPMDAAQETTVSPPENFPPRVHMGELPEFATLPVQGGETILMKGTVTKGHRSRARLNTMKALRELERMYEIHHSEKIENVDLHLSHPLVRTVMGLILFTVCGGFVMMFVVYAMCLAKRQATRDLERAPLTATPPAAKEEDDLKEEPEFFVAYREEGEMDIGGQKVPGTLRRSVRVQKRPKGWVQPAAAPASGLDNLPLPPQPERGNPTGEHDYESMN